jgi:lipid-binding SYLF domain-containing protein
MYSWIEINQSAAIYSLGTTQLLLKRLAKSSLSLVRNQGIWQVWKSFSHGWIFTGDGGSGLLVLSEKNRILFLLTTLYMMFSILAYWLNEAMFIRFGASTRL